MARNPSAAGYDAMMLNKGVRVKICCIASIAEAWLAIDHGASAVGLVSAMPSGPGPIPEDLIAEIAATVPPEDPNAIAAAVETLAAMTLAERRDMGIRGRRYVEQHHSFSILGYRLEEVLQSALSSSELARNEQPKK